MNSTNVIMWMTAAKHFIDFIEKLIRLFHAIKDSLDIMLQ
mgnify:CR=1 FL=1